MKRGNGHCLNSLDEQTFDVDEQAPLGCKDEVPRAVKRVSEIFQQPTFLKRVSGDDVRQGGLGNCWFVAALTAIANTEDGIRKICVDYDTSR